MLCCLSLLLHWPLKWYKPIYRPVTSFRYFEHLIFPYSENSRLLALLLLKLRQRCVLIESVRIMFERSHALNWFCWYYCEILEYREEPNSLWSKNDTEIPRWNVIWDLPSDSLKWGVLLIPLEWCVRINLSCEQLVMQKVK